jgi:hypothetical protein
MLTCKCWVITGASFIQVDGNVYLDKADAQLAFDQKVLEMEMPGQFKTPLALSQSTLILAFGVTDQEISPESLKKLILSG